jgi:N utilization substance protein B
MSFRHIARAVVLQTCFQLDSQDSEWDFKEAQDILKQNNELIPGGDIVYAEGLFDLISQKRFEIDEVIKRVAPDWPIEKIATMDRNILRLGLAELLFYEKLDIPPKVAINESIELAKEYGGDNSSRFINGVLGSVYKELGEPRKTEGKKRKEPKESSEKLAGAIVFAQNEGVIYLALVHNVFGYWTLPKGHIEEDEKLKKAVGRIVEEELGVTVEVKDEIGSNEYILQESTQPHEKKHVTYFITESDFVDIKLGTSNGLDDAKWFSLQDVVNVQMYNDILPIVTNAITTYAAQQS